MVDLFLPHHVHFCYRGDAVVFLDLQRDDYTFVGAEGAAALRCLSSLKASVAPPESRAALNELLDGGLLTTDQTAGRAIAPTTATPATQPLLDDEAVASARASLGHLLNFFAACIYADARLRWGQLHRTIGRVERCKARRKTSTPFDIERARELVAVFGRLRPLFPRRHLCLYDSLALIEFLARYGIFPSWLFAVRLEPWAAHCWVQEAGFIFNEEPEETAGYTPVMVI
jgi:hypothetical protein